MNLVLPDRVEAKLSSQQALLDLGVGMYLNERMTRRTAAEVPRNRLVLKNWVDKVLSLRQEGMPWCPETRLVPSELVEKELNQLKEGRGWTDHWQIHSLR
jgi:hypothetical protein